MSFLKAEWRKLVMANYVIDPTILKPYIPYKTELDVWQGRCYVSLVGFMFVDTKMLGIKIPFHVNFEEVNLRFYVRYKEEENWKRGVVFLKEIVPKPALTFVANTLYKEHYATMPMRHEWKNNLDNQVINYQWKCKGNWQMLKVIADKNPTPILPESEAEFITEHYWGYTKINDKCTFEYEVKHPKWEQYAVQNYEIDVDFGLVYGNNFAFLTGLKPDSVLLAEGSEISVENKKIVSN